MNNINFIPFPNMTTERLNLRQVVAEDEKEIFSLNSDEKVIEFLDRPKYKSLEQALHFIATINGGIAKNEWIFWAITLKNKNELIGTICLWNISKEECKAEVGYELMPDYQGKGLMQEALIVVLEYGFNNMKLNLIEGYINPKNLKSIKLMERNDFVKLGNFKEKGSTEGEFVDMIVYGLENKSRPLNI